jgi:hypothetical protein
MTKISRSPQRHTFQKGGYLDRKAEEGKTPETDDNVKAIVEMYESWEIDDKKKESDPEWQKDNLEWDLRTTDWILGKTRKSEVYAQNLYASMCNNEFQKLDTWLVLKEQTWSCSWRHAGGIIADMRQEGDYIDWYCSGINSGWDMEREDFKKMTAEAQCDYLVKKKITDQYAREGQITDEIRDDLKLLGWIPHSGDFENFE